MKQTQEQITSRQTSMKQTKCEAWEVKKQDVASQTCIMHGLSTHYKEEKRNWRKKENALKVCRFMPTESQRSMHEDASRKLAKLREAELRHNRWKARTVNVTETVVKTCKTKISGSKKKAQGHEAKAEVQEHNDQETHFCLKTSTG